jgi:Tol biopolymer transport system component
VPNDNNDTLDLFLRDRLSSTTERVNVTSMGRESRTAEGTYGMSDITPDGRWIVYASYASDLVEGDTNGHYDVFLRDRHLGLTQRLSVGPDGVEGNGESVSPSISDNGRYVTFASLAGNLVLEDTDQLADIFWFDRAAGPLHRLSVAASGAPANADTITWGHAMSASGDVVAFASWASNFVANDTNRAIDVFVRDLSQGHGRARVLRPTADAYVRGGTFAAQNAGTSRNLLAKLGISPDHHRRSYIRFDISDIDTITTATLRLYGRVSNATTNRVRTGVFRVSNQLWDEQTVTWNTRPSYGPLLGIVNVTGTTPQWVEIDVTTLLQTEKRAGLNDVSVALRTLEHTSAYASFDSREAGPSGPQLVITP